MAWQPVPPSLEGVVKGPEYAAGYRRPGAAGKADRSGAHECLDANEPCGRLTEN